MDNIKPIYLLADSQVLFWKENGTFFLNRILKNWESEGKNIELKASYIGASNKDDPYFYEIFKSAMEQINIRNCRMIPSIPRIGDTDFLMLSHIILLSGGDVKKGWKVLKKNGIDKIIVERYQKGSTIIGVSAGAIQLGLGSWDDINSTLLDTFKVIPFVIDVHDEENDWKYLIEAVNNNDEHCKGFGIPTGGGMIFYPDWSIEAIRHSLTEIELSKDKKMKQALILPENEVN